MQNFVDFTLPDGYNQTTTLSQILADGPVLLLFYRGQWWGAWKKQLSRVRQLIASFNQHHAQILAISVDTPAEARQYKEDLNLPFAVLSDETRVSICAYGASDTAEKNGKVIAKVATVIIDQNQNIVYKYVGTHWSDRPTEEKLIEILARIAGE